MNKKSISIINCQDHLLFYQPLMKILKLLQRLMNSIKVQTKGRNNPIKSMSQIQCRILQQNKKKKCFQNNKVCKRIRYLRVVKFKIFWLIAQNKVIYPIKMTTTQFNQMNAKWKIIKKNRSNELLKNQYQTSSRFQILQTKII